jgi:hypothetical protein
MLSLGELISSTADNLRIDGQFTGSVNGRNLDLIQSSIPQELQSGLSGWPQSTVGASTYIETLSTMYDRTMSTLDSNFTDNLLSIMANGNVPFATSVNGLIGGATRSGDPAAMSTGTFTNDFWNQLVVQQPAVQVPESSNASRAAQRGLLNKLAQSVPLLIQQMNPNRDVASQVTPSQTVLSSIMLLSSATIPPVGLNEVDLGSSVLTLGPMNFTASSSGAGFNGSDLWVYWEDQGVAGPQIEFNTDSIGWTGVFEANFTARCATTKEIVDLMVGPKVVESFSCTANTKVSFNTTFTARYDQVISLSTTGTVAAFGLVGRIKLIDAMPIHTWTGLVNDAGAMIEESNVLGLVGEVKGGVNHIFDPDVMRLLTEVSILSSKRSNSNGNDLFSALIDKLGYTGDYGGAVSPYDNVWDPNFWFSSTSTFNESSLTLAQRKTVYKSWYAQLPLIIVSTLVGSYGS